MFYKLEEKTPVPCNSASEWKQWIYEARDCRIIAQDDTGDFIVTTVFQGVDHIAPDSPSPLLFETLIYDYRNGLVEGNHGLYPTWEEAAAGHRRAVLRVRNSSRGEIVSGVEDDAD
jgi:hypothetical protein